MEAAPPEGGGGAGRDKYGDQTIHYPHRPSHLLYVPCENLLGIGRQLASGGTQPSVGKIKVGVTVQGIYQGGCGCPDLRENLCGGGSGGSDIWVGDAGY